jgi:8-oxo-dGTP diphosphatase
MHSVGVGVFVRRGRDVLVGVRGPESKRGAGCLALPGGKVGYKESVADCVLREVREETGLEVRFADARSSNVPGLLGVTDHFPDEGLHHLSLWVLTYHVSGEAAVLEPGKCEGWRWMQPRDVVRDVEPGTEQYYWTPPDLWRQMLFHVFQF